MLERAVSQLSGRASVCRNDEQLFVSLLQVAILVGPINHPANRFGRFGPFGALGFGRHLDERLCIIRHGHGKGEPTAIGRPFHTAGGFGTAGDFCDLA